jgi:hypothetical protein
MNNFPAVQPAQTLQEFHPADISYVLLVQVLLVSSEDLKAPADLE